MMIYQSEPEEMLLFLDTYPDGVTSLPVEEMRKVCRELLQLRADKDPQPGDPCVVWYAGGGRFNAYVREIIKPGQDVSVREVGMASEYRVRKYVDGWYALDTHNHKNQGICVLMGVRDETDIPV
jgi:hypothetical protein